MGFLKKIAKSVKKRGRKIKKASRRRGRFFKSAGRRSGLSSLGGKLAKGRKRGFKKRGGFFKKIKSRFKKFGRRGGIGSLRGKRGGPIAEALRNRLNNMDQKNQTAQAAGLAAQSQFMGPQVTPQMQQAATQMQQGMNQPAVTPSQAQSAAMAAQSQFMGPQMAATQMQQGMNQGGFQGDPYDDPIKYSADMSAQEKLRLGNKMRAHAERLGHGTPASGGDIANMLGKPPMDISVAEPAGQQAPQGLQDFMAQNIDPRQQAQFAGLPISEQFKYMQGMSGGGMGGQPQIPSKHNDRMRFMPQIPKMAVPQQAMSDFERQEMEMNGRRAGGSAHTMGGLMFNPATAFRNSPSPEEIQQAQSGPRRRAGSIEDMRNSMGFRGIRRRRPEPRGLRRAPRRRMMGMFGGGRFGGGGGMNQEYGRL